MGDTSTKIRTPLAILLFENNIDYREGGRLFGCSAQQLHRIAEGARKARGKVAERILGVVTGQLTISELRAAVSHAAAEGGAVGSLLTRRQTVAGGVGPSPAASVTGGAE